MKPPLRIAILECDTPPPKADAKYHGYRGVFTKLLLAGADALDQPETVSSRQGLEISGYDVVTKQEYPNLDDVDAILLTGSKYNAFDDEAWILKLVDFTKTVLAQRRVRIIGVCFGHQILGRALGVKMGRSDIGWETSVCIVKLTEQGARLFEKDVMSIHQMHRDVVYECPLEVELLGSSPRCQVQGLYVKDRFISVQGHPEFNEEIMRELLNTRHDSGIFDDEQYKDGMDRVANHHDGVTISKAFIKFLLDD